MNIKKILYLISSVTLVGCASHPTSINTVLDPSVDSAELLSELPDDNHKLATPLKLNLKSDQDGIKVFGFTFGKTDIRELPQRCFYSNSPIFRQNENIPAEAPMLFLWSWQNSGQINIRAKEKRVGECFGNGIENVSMSFANKKLSWIRVTYRKRHFEEIRQNISSAIEKLNLSCKSRSQGLKCDNDQVELWILNYEPYSETVEVEIKDKSLLAKALAYLKLNGFPRYGNFHFGLDTKKSLSNLMSRAGYEQRNNIDRLINEYSTVNILGRPNGGAVFGELGVHEIFFDHNDVLYSMWYTFDDNRRPRLDYIKSILGKEFIYQGQTRCWLMSPGEPLVDEVFWHESYLPEKTGGIPLYVVNVRVGKLTGRVYSMEITNPLFRIDKF